MRFSFRELSEANNNPSAFRRKMTAPSAVQPQFRYSYYNVLLNSIFHFHKCHNDATQGEEYLFRKLDAFKDARRKEFIKDQFDWYVGDYLGKRITTSDFRQNIRIVPDIPLRFEVIIAGQIGRIDIGSSKGYVAWIFRSQDSSGWINELSMPLVQSHLAKNVFDVPTSEVVMGLYNFNERIIEQHSYSDRELLAAKLTFDRLLKRLNLA